MPLEGEFAHNKSIQRIVQSEKVRELLGSFRTRKAQSREELLATLNCVSIPIGDWKPEQVIAVDGSYSTVSLENGFPGAEAAYVTVAAVIIDVLKIRELDQYRPVNPVAFRKTRDAETIDSALPGCNVVSEGQESAVSSLRKALYETFRDKKAFHDGESLLDTYEALLKHKPLESHEQPCPYGDDCGGSDLNYKRDSHDYPCVCPDQKALYSTDALRIHEGMNPVGSNGAMFAEIMQVWERIWVIHVLRNMETAGLLSSLKRLAFVMDGPLAVFGHPAWLSNAIYKELSRLNEKVKQATGGMDILLIGIEKTGSFAQHLEMLDQEVSGSSGKLPPRFTALISDDYIKQNIVFSESERLYGRQTYFGRKLYYKTSTGALLTAQLPYLSEEHKNSKKAEVSQYPRLQDALAVLEEMASSRYKNAITPLVEAHAEAAIPLNLGRKVLEELAKKLMRDSD